MGTSIERHSAVTDLHRRGEGFGVPGLRCDGMDVVATYEVMREAINRVRDDHRPLLVEAVTYRFRGHSMADPEEYRTKEQVAEWRERDPIPGFAERLVRGGQLEQGGLEEIDRAVVRRIDDAVAFADSSAFPPPESLYDHVYVLGDQVRGWYSVDERSAGVHRGEDERSLAEAARGPEGAYHEAVEQAGRESVERRDPSEGDPESADDPESSEGAS
jgi:TPP-dependent pyruvate/acetoin dehydrogenase alpha subunit